MIIGMNKQLFKQLCLNYNKPADIELHKLWDEELEQYDPEEIERAIRNIMAKDKYFPNLSRVIEEIKKIGFKEISEEKMGERFKKINVIPEWYGKEIKNQEIDRETLDTFDDFQDFLKDFRNEENY